MGLLEPGENKLVNRRRGPVCVLDGGRAFRLNGAPGPMLLPALLQVEIVVFATLVCGISSGQGAPSLIQETKSEIEASESFFLGGI